MTQKGEQLTMDAALCAAASSVPFSGIGWNSLSPFQKFVSPLTDEEIHKVKAAWAEVVLTPGVIAEAHATLSAAPAFSVPTYLDIGVLTPSEALAEINAGTATSCVDCGAAESHFHKPDCPVLGKLQNIYDAKVGVLKLSLSPESAYVLHLGDVPQSIASYVSAKLSAQGVNAVVVVGPNGEQWQAKELPKDTTFVSTWKCVGCGHEGTNQLDFQKTTGLCKACSKDGIAVIDTKAMTEQQKTEMLALYGKFVKGFNTDEQPVKCDDCGSYYAKALQHKHKNACLKWTCISCKVKFSTWPDPQKKVFGAKPVCASCLSTAPHLKSTVIVPSKTPAYYDDPDGKLDSHGDSGSHDTYAFVQPTKE